MVNPEKGLALQKQVTQIKQQYGFEVKPGKKLLPLIKKLMRAKAIRGESPRENWWQAKAPAAPEREVTAEEKKEQKQQEKQKQSEQPEQTGKQNNTNVANRTQSDSDSSDIAKIGGIMLYIAIGILLILFLLAK